MIDNNANGVAQHGKNSIKDIELIVYNFDGVLTDNRVIVFETGSEAVMVNRSDGLAIGMIKGARIEQILTTETDRVVESRANKIGIQVIKGVDNKKETLLTYCKENDIPLEHVVYVGNDLNDLESMKIVGYPIAPADAHIEVKRIAKVVTKARGGDGVIREVLDFVI